MYYIGDGYTIEEVTILGKEEDEFIIQYKDGYTCSVPKYKCYNSKDEIISEVMGSLEYDIDQAKCDLEQAQEDLEIAQEKLKNFKQKYEI